MARTHGTVSTYGYGCRCDACAAAQRAYHASKRKPCPKCGTLMKHTSKTCKGCSANPGGPSIQPHVTILMPLSDMQNPAWRPRHYPPACTTCKGFGYVKTSIRTEWSLCRACLASPGHAMTHTEWTETRT